jgi:hypothetical protein
MGLYSRHKLDKTEMGFPFFIVTSIECSFCRLIKRPGSFLESVIGRECGSPW